MSMPSSRPTASINANPAMVIPLAARIEVGRSEVAEIAPPNMSVRARIGLALQANQRMDIQAAGELYSALIPLRGLMLIWAISADRLLELMAWTMGNLDKSAEHFEESLAFCRKASYRPDLFWTCCDYADTLLQRDGPGDKEKAVALLDESLAISSELGMRPLMERVMERVLSRREILKA